MKKGEVLSRSITDISQTLSNFKPFANSVESIYLVEASPHLRAQQAQLLSGTTNLTENEVGWSAPCKYLPGCNIVWCEDIRMIPKGKYDYLASHPHRLIDQTCRRKQIPLYSRPRILRRSPHPHLPKRILIKHPRLLNNHDANRTHQTQNRPSSPSKPMARTCRVTSITLRDNPDNHLTTIYVPRHEERGRRLPPHRLQVPNPTLPVPPANVCTLQSALQNPRRHHRDIPRVSGLHIGFRNEDRRFQSRPTSISSSA